MKRFPQEVELAERTVRAADNNAKLHVALQAKAKQAERMMVANQGLTFENSTLRNDVDLAKVSEVGRRAKLPWYRHIIRAARLPDRVIFCWK